jgi:hypothetical protein
VPTCGQHQLIVGALCAYIDNLRLQCSPCYSLSFDKRSAACNTQMQTADTTASDDPDDAPCKSLVTGSCSVAQRTLLDVR